MAHKFDLTLVIIYLIVTMLVGIWSSRKAKTLEEYAVGNRNFPTIVLVMTICATWLSGSGTINISEQVFRVGIIYIVITFAQSIGQLLVAYIFAPRLKEFQQKCISVGDVMASIYGKPSGIISGIAGLILSAGFIAAQIKAMSFVLSYFLGINNLAGVLISSLITVMYSVIGGVRAVTYTDVVQFIALTVAIPMVLNVGVDIIGGYNELIAKIPPHMLTIELSHENIIKFLPLMIYFTIPTFNPPLMQRMLMARNIEQIAVSFKITAFVLMGYHLVAGLIGLVAYALNPELTSNHAIIFIIDQYLPVGMKGVAVIGMLSVIMSTADSYLNAGAVSFVHDSIKPLVNISEKTELGLSKFITLVMGVVAIYMALSFDNLLAIILFSQQFWGPIIAIPLIFGLLGFRTRPAALYTAMIAGMALHLLWRLYELDRVIGIPSLIPAYVLSSLTLFGTNVILKMLHKNQKTISIS
ncbi:MAG: sodium:solute symporter family protein [Rickettsiaceae bacterium]|jgi:SSS family solute:Na+ symporter|nr:sodium:solute symporter family protein [Rickettsiaceae bacterium]